MLADRIGWRIRKTYKVDHRYDYRPDGLEFVNL
jgi:hypothetical protein